MAFWLLNSSSAFLRVSWFAQTLISAVKLSAPRFLAGLRPNPMRLNQAGIHEAGRESLNRGFMASELIVCLIPGFRVSCSNFDFFPVQRF
jgi:hypothetical protein